MVAKKQKIKQAKNKSNKTQEHFFSEKNDNKEFNDQLFYYSSFGGFLLGSKAREKLIFKQLDKLNKKQFFLEIGCAQGYYLKKALEKTNNVFGIDVSKESIKIAKKLGANVKVASGKKIPFKQTFDVVLCTETLEHIPNWKKSVREINRVTKKNGLIIITIPLEKSFFWRFGSIFFDPEKTRGHINLLTVSDIEKEFKSFKLIEKRFVQTMSQTLNKFLPQKESISMYAFFVFKKK